MRRGRVKWFSPELGYGFILIDQDVEVFVHHSDIQSEGFRMLHDGEEVEFELHNTQRGFQARNVRRLGIETNAADTESEKQTDQQT
jgi:CspA family cold shock protein